jgi:chromosome partitioning protein
LKTIVVSNRKGGSGKTTTSISLAAGLAKKHTVLLIDFDTQGHASIGVGSNPVEVGGAHSIFTGASLSSTFLPTVTKNLTISPASLFFDVYEFADLRGVLKSRFRAEKIADFFDYCIIDTPPTLDALLKNALEVANAVVIPVAPHYLGVVGVDQMLRAIYRVSLEANSAIEFVGILPVMYNAHIAEHKEAVQILEDTFGKEKLFSPIGVDIAMVNQFAKKVPAVLGDKRSKASKHYKIFTAELVEKLEKGNQ